MEEGGAGGVWRPLLDGYVLVRVRMSSVTTGQASQCTRAGPFLFRRAQRGPPSVVECNAMPQVRLVLQSVEAGADSAAVCAEGFTRGCVAIRGRDDADELRALLELPDVYAEARRLALLNVGRMLA